jgi:NADH dehydrogenase
VEAEMALDKKGRLPVNGFFQVQNHDNIFALGDIACVTGINGQPVPGTAQDAWDQAKYLAYALPFILKNQKPPKQYKNKKHGFIVSLGGKWAIADFGHFYLKGYIGYVINQLAHLRYYMSVVGIWKAIKYILFQDEIYGRND